MGLILKGWLKIFKMFWMEVCFCCMCVCIIWLASIFRRSSGAKFLKLWRRRIILFFLIWCIKVLFWVIVNVMCKWLEFLLKMDIRLCLYNFLWRIWVCTVNVSVSWAWCVKIRKKLIVLSCNLRWLCVWCIWIYLCMVCLLFLWFLVMLCLRCSGTRKWRVWRIVLLKCERFCVRILKKVVWFFCGSMLLIKLVCFVLVGWLVSKWINCELIIIFIWFVTVEFLWWAWRVRTLVV